MTVRALRMKEALDTLPDIADLAPLRHALAGGAQEDRERVWSGLGRYATIDSRLADVRAMEARIGELADRVRERTERLFRHSVDALKALERQDLAGAARALVAAGELEEEDGNLDSADHYYRKAAELGRRPRDRRVEGLALRRLGRVRRAAGELAAARELYRRGYDIAEGMGDRDGAVVACQGLGNLAVDQGLWEEARRWYARGLELVEHESPGRLHWQLYNNMAIVELRTDALDASEAWLERMREVIESTGDDSARRYLDNGIGQLLLARGSVEEAETAYRRAIRGADDARSRANFLLNLSGALIRRNRLGEAEALIREAEDLILIHRLVGILPETYRKLGSIARARGDADGFLFFEQALGSCRRYELPPVQVAATQHEYGLWNQTMGQLDEAEARFTEAMSTYTELELTREADQVAADLDRLEAPQPNQQNESGDADETL